MSWITPIKNTFIKFIVKGNGSGGGGGIDEETLNEKLAQFYATTETKILNIVNQKLASYVLQTAFNELEAKVTNLENTVNNLPTTSITNKLSFIEGGFDIPLNNVTITTGYSVSEIISSFTTPQGTTIDFDTIKKYLVNREFSPLTITTTNGNEDPTGDAYWFPTLDQGANFIGIGDSFYSNSIIFVAITTTLNKQLNLGSKGKLSVGFRFLLSDTMEQILNKPKTLYAMNSLNTGGIKAKITKWVDIGGDNS